MQTYEREIKNFNNRRTQQENWSWFPCFLFFRPYSSLHRPNDHQRPRRSGWPKWSFSENRVFVQAWFPVTARMIPKLGGWEVSVKWPKRLKKKRWDPASTIYKRKHGSVYFLSKLFNVLNSVIAPTINKIMAWSIR